MKYTYKIQQDDIAGNPRDEFDSISKFYGVKGYYCVGGKNDVEFRYQEHLDNQIKEFRKERAVIVPFSSNAGKCFAVVEESQLKDEYLKFGYSMRRAKYHARKCAEGEIAEFLAWTNGEVYGYVVRDERGEVMDSCWGFYGDDGRKEAEAQANAFIEWKIQEDAKQDVLLNACLAI